MPLLFVSLIIESFKYIFLKFNFKKFGKSYVDSTYCFCRDNLAVDTFRNKKVFLPSAKYLTEKLVKEPELFSNLYKTSLKEIKEIDILSEKIEPIGLKLGDLKEFYFLYKSVFLPFMTLQVFPLIIERVLTDIGDDKGKKLLKKNKNILIKWRRNTHEAQIELEDIFYLFLKKLKKHLKANFEFWTDYEMITFFKTLKKPCFSEVHKRGKIYLLLGEINSVPPYKIYTGQKLNKAYQRLLEITKLKTTGNKFKGEVVYRGNVKGEIYVSSNKKELKKLPPGKILVVRVIEMDDFRILKNKKIKGIVTEEGGVTTHIAIVGRELKIPIITKIKGAASIFKDGDLVEVDAKRGLVKILKRK